MSLFAWQSVSKNTDNTCRMCPNVCKNIDWVYLPRTLWSNQNAIALHVDESQANEAADKGPQLTKQEMDSIGLKENTAHTKIEISYDAEYKYIICWGCICGICCFPFIYCIIKNCCLRLKRSQTLKIVVTQTHLIRTQDEVKYCGDRWYETYDQIPLQDITHLSVRQRGCIEKCFHSKCIRIVEKGDYDESKGYQPYANPPSWGIYGVSDPQQAAKLIYSTQSNLGVKCSTRDFIIPQLPKPVILGIVLSIVLSIIAYFASSLLFYNIFYDIILDELLSIITFINVTILLIILIYQFVKSNSNQHTSRLIMKFGLMTLSLRIISVLYMICIMLFVIYRFVFIIYYSCSAKQ
eukprot:266450_1